MNGLLVDMKFCTGCHSCEVACKNEKGLALDQYGIKIAQVGPFEIADQDWVFDYVPHITRVCDLCEDRVARGEKPSCVLHCLGKALEFGSVDELAKKLVEKGNNSHLMIP